MTTFQKFRGINNVAPIERLKLAELSVATNVDVGLDAELRRRSGYTVQAAGEHRNVFTSSIGTLYATVGAGDLKNITTNTVVHAGLGHTRVWYTELPDGSLLYTNGTSSGQITAAGVRQDWGVAAPTSAGFASAVAGQLLAGTYQYAISHVRLSDGRESALKASTPFPLTAGQTVSLWGVTVPPGHKLNVYLTAANGTTFFLAGSTNFGVFSFAGKPSDLVLPARSEFLQEPPAGTMLAFWRGRVLLASGRSLYASRTHQWHLFDLRRDFKQFDADITMVMPLTGGIFVGTTQDLYWLGGTEFDKLTMNNATTGRVVKGSGVAIPGELIKRREMNGQPIAGADNAMMCICDGRIVAGFADGDIARMTEGVYHRTDLTEVWATHRVVDGIPQYLAALV